jgi:hypothetical protein
VLKDAARLGAAKRRRFLGENGSGEQQGDGEQSREDLYIASDGRREAFIHRKTGAN